MCLMTIKLHVIAVTQMLCWQDFQLLVLIWSGLRWDQTGHPSIQQSSLESVPMYSVLFQKA